MERIDKELKVDLGDRSYPIKIGRDFGSEIASFISESLKAGKQVGVLIDEGFFLSQNEFSKKIIASTPYLIIPSGEPSKSVDQLVRAWDFLASLKMDRGGLIFAVGGGVVGDLAGFVAATYLRGVSFHQIPTTLLAMVDSSVGGKTGINLQAGKNLIGSFHQPDCVWADLDLLSSLPVREFSAGMAEVVKYGMLGDKELFDQLVATEKPFSANSRDLPDLIHRCCSIKAKIVREDERELSGLLGGRALLNLGHTFGHAIEKVSGFGTYLHGEAVAIGLLCAFRLSQVLDKCQRNYEKDLVNLLELYKLPTKLRQPIKSDDLINAMYADKKVDRGMLRFVLMKEIGEAYCADGVDSESIKRVWSSVGAI